MRGKQLTVLLLTAGTPSPLPKRDPCLLIIRAYARLDCENDDNKYYYDIINIIRIRISPQGNQRSRKIVLCGTTNSCQGQRRGSPTAAGPLPEEGGEREGAQRARGSTALSRAAQAPGSVGRCSAGTVTEVAECWRLSSDSHGDHRGWGPVSPQTRPLKNEGRTNQTSSSKTALAAVWEVDRSQPETD